MKYFSIIIVAFVLLTACKTQQEKNSFTDKDNFFTVNFKQEPIKAVDTFDTQVGPIILHTFMVEEGEKLAKTVTYSDYPKKITENEDPYKILESAKNGAIKSLGVTNIEKAEKITEFEVPGYELIGSNDLGFHIHYKLFLKENRLFQIGFLKECEKKVNEKEQEFIESFVIL